MKLGKISVKCRKKGKRTKTQNERDRPRNRSPPGTAKVHPATTWATCVRPIQGPYRVTTT